MSSSVETERTKDGRIYLLLHNRRRKMVLTVTCCGDTNCSMERIIGKADRKKQDATSTTLTGSQGNLANGKHLSRTASGTFVYSHIEVTASPGVSRAQHKSLQCDGGQASRRRTKHASGLYGDHHALETRVIRYLRLQLPNAQQPRAIGPMWTFLLNQKRKSG